MGDGEERGALEGMITVPSIPIMVLKEATITMIAVISRTLQWTKTVIVHQQARGGTEGKKNTRKKKKKKQGS